MSLASPEKEVELELDSLTRDLFRCLQWSPKPDVAASLRPTYWSIAKTLNASPKTVKGRLDLLHEKGIVGRIRAIPDVSILGLERKTVSATASAPVVKRMKEKTHLFDFLESVQVSRVFELPEGGARHHQPTDSHFVRLDLVHERGFRQNDLTRMLSILQEVFGRFTVIPDGSPGPRAASLNPDSRLVRVLREFTRTPFAEIGDLSESASVSEGTARKYLRMLVRMHAFRFEPAIDLGKTDTTSFFVRVAVEAGRRSGALAKLKARLSENWLLEDVGRDKVAGVACEAQTLSQAEELYSSVTEDPELAAALMLLGMQTIDNQPNVSYMRGGNAAETERLNREGPEAEEKRVRLLVAQVR